MLGFRLLDSQFSLGVPAGEPDRFTAEGFFYAVDPERRKWGRDATNEVTFRPSDRRLSTSCSKAPAKTFEKRSRCTAKSRTLYALEMNIL